MLKVLRIVQHTRKIFNSDAFQEHGCAYFSLNLLINWGKFQGAKCLYKFESLQAGIFSKI